jgi:hypothetical protein
MYRRRAAGDRCCLPSTFAPAAVSTMNTSRPRFDPAFALALGLMALTAVGFVSERNGGATLMCAMCLAGLVAGGIVGVPGRVLLPVAFGFVVVLWMNWTGLPASPRETSAFAHAIGGSLVGWALVEVLRRRIRDWPSVALAALTVVIVLTLVWELGEYVGDRLFDTALEPGWRDSAIDIFFGTAGGIVGIAVAGLAASLRRAD